MKTFDTTKIYQMSSDSKLALLDKLSDNLDKCIEMSREKTFNLGSHKKKFMKVKSWRTDEIAEKITRRKRL